MIKHFDPDSPVILPISMREKGIKYTPPKPKSTMIASDGVREFHTGGTRKGVFPHELFSHLRKKYGG